MPTSALVTSLSRSPLSMLGAASGLSVGSSRFNEHIITPLSPCAVGVDMAGIGTGTASSTAYPAASRALACPFVLAAPFLIRKVFWFNGLTATTDSADVGVYTEAGALVVSGGGTAISGNSQLQEVNVTDILLPPGRYWLAMSQSGVTATPIVVATVVAACLRAIGCAQMAAAYPLPSTFTPAAVASSNFPIMGIASRTLAA